MRFANLKTNITREIQKKKKRLPLLCVEGVWNRRTEERTREMYYEEVSLVSAKSFLGAVTAVIPVQWQAL